MKTKALFFGIIFLFLLNSCYSDGDFEPISCESHLGFDTSKGDIILASQQQVIAFGNKSISHIKGHLYIGHCTDRGANNIQNIDALSSITQIDGNLIIAKNNKLSSILGLQNLERIGGVLSIVDNSSLKNLHGLHNLSSIGRVLNISLMNELENLDDFEKLSSIGSLDLWANQNIDNLNGLLSVTSLHGYVSLIMNDALTTVRGLRNINMDTIEYLKIESNKELLNLNGLEKLQTIASDKNGIEQGQLLILSNQKLKNISALRNLTDISNSIEVRWNPVLTTIEGLSGLTSANGLLWITDNNQLLSIDGLRNITTTSGSLVIFNNDIITDIDGLGALSHIGTTLDIFDNARLANLCGLTKLLQTDGGLKEGSFTTNAPYYNIKDNLYNPTRENLTNGNCSQ